MVAKVQFYLSTIFLVTLFTQCHPTQKISLNEKSIETSKITGDLTTFNGLIQNGASYSISPVGSSGYRALLILKDRTGNAVSNNIYVYQLKLNYKDNTPTSELTSVGVEKLLLQFTPEKIDKLDANTLTGWEFNDIQTFCQMVNLSGDVSFQLIPVIVNDSSVNPAGYYNGIDIQRNPCNLSHIVNITHRTSLPLGGYHEDRVKCIPDDYKGSVLTDVNDSGDTTWFKKAEKAVTKDKSAAGLKLPLYDTLSRATFPFSCDANYDFLVNLYRNKKGMIKMVGVVNHAAQKKNLPPQTLLVKAGTYQVGNYLFEFTVPAAKTSTTNPTSPIAGAPATRPPNRAASPTPADSAHLAHPDSTHLVHPDTTHPMPAASPNPTNAASPNPAPTIPPATNGDTQLLVSRQAFPGAPIDTLLAVSLSQSQKTYTIATADGADNAVITLPTTKKDGISSITFKLSTIPENLYPFDPLLDPLHGVTNLQRWLGIRFKNPNSRIPTLNSICAGELASQVYSHDTSSSRTATAAPAATATSATDTSKKAKDSTAKNSSKLVKPGTVSIIPTDPYTMTTTTNEGYIQVYLQLPGAYDSSACKIPFKMKRNNLSNHLKPDSTVTVSKRAWDSAVYFHQGKVLVNVPVKYDSVSDTLFRIQEDYLVINDSVNDGMKVVKLRIYKPTAAFWVEVGANFELLNGFSAKNVYAGILLFDKDMASFHIRGREWDLSIIGGAQESLTSSTGITADSGIVYRDNSSLTVNAINGGYPVYRDTGIVTVTSTTRNIGVFVEPAVRLTKLPTNHNGAHLFVALYNEFLWQQVTTHTDYSKSSRDNGVTSYVSASTLSKYTFRHDTSRTDDFRASAIAIGFPFYLKRNAFTFFVNPTFGFTNQKFTPIRPFADPHKLAQVYQYPTDSIPSGYPVTYLQPRCSWNPFYLIQFRFNEEKYDFTITGEIRTLLLRNASPLVTLTISKKFDLSTLINSLFSPASAKTNN